MESLMKQRHRCLAILFVLLSIHPLFAAADDATWVQIHDTVFGARPDKLGPIGGGDTYAGTFTKSDHTVKDLDTLLEALSKAKAGDVVFIPGEMELDLTARIFVEQLVLEVPEGVTLAGDRGLNGSRGALLSSDALQTPVMIRAIGPNVRVTGLRIRGPNPKRYLDHHHRAFGPGGLGRKYYYKFPISNGIQTKHPALEVDNCEISGFGHAGIHLVTGEGHHIHHNFIHHCQYDGLGYGVCLDKASAMIEYNRFDWNRHSIAGTGRPSCSYVARHNLEAGESLSHCFDMHGGRDRKDGTDIAGTRVEIYSNTFRAAETAVVIRGVPQETCQIHHNWFLKHAGAAEAVRASARTKVENNAYGDNPVRVE
jgi:hypothetical protein